MCGVACVSQCCRHICNWFNIATKSSYGQQPVIMKVWLSLFDIIETGFSPLSPFFDGLNTVLFFLASCYLFQPVLWCMVLHILQNRKRSTFPVSGFPQWPWFTNCMIDTVLLSTCVIDTCKWLLNFHPLEIHLPGSTSVYKAHLKLNGGTTCLLLRILPLDLPAFTFWTSS